MRRMPLAVLLVAVGALGGCERCSPGSGGHAATHSRDAAESPQDPLATIRWDDTPLDWNRPVPATPPGGVAQAGYVGSDACKDCHRDVYTSYERHSMARTGMRPMATLDARWLARIFDASQPVQHERSGFWYRPYREGKRYFVEEYVLDGGGARVQSQVEPIEYAYSAGSYGVAFYFARGERLYQIPLDFYPQANRWGIDPGFREGNPRFSKSLETFCISCHADYPRKRAGTDRVFFGPLGSGVGCERCHGPGERHVQTLRAADIVDPARLAPQRQLDVCTQCHESDESTLRAGRDDFSYRPGEPVSAYRVNFVGQPAEPDRFILLAHPERMVQSACWKGSGGRLVCTSCHDPHKSSFEQPATWWDQKCNACHADRPCTETAEARATQGDHCVPCHMRRGAPTSPTLVTITDHWIQRRPPPVRPGSEQPRSLVAWPELVGEPTAGNDLASIQAVALARLGRPDAAVAEAARAAGEGVHLPVLYEWLAGRFRQANQPWNAARAMATILRFDPDSPGALLGYARVMLDRGDEQALAEATHALDRMLAIDPDDPEALETKATYLFRGGQVDAARPLFARAAALSPAAGSAHVALAVLARRDGREADAIAELEAARAITPGDSWVLEQLAAAYARRGDTAHGAAIERARKYFASIAGGSPASASRWLPDAWR